MVNTATLQARVVTTLDDTKLQELNNLIRTLVPADPAAPTECQLLDVSKHRKLSHNAKGYVQIKVKTASIESYSPNTKVQLHQLICWMHPDPLLRAEFREAIRGAGVNGNELSHLCNEKTCCNSNHLVAESSYRNKCRWTCPVAIQINGTVVECCNHTPRCIITDAVRDSLLKYVTDQNGQPFKV